MATLYSGSLAGGKSVAGLLLAVTQPCAGVQVQVSGTGFVAVERGIAVSYAFSIDGGVTYSAYSPFLEVPPASPSNTLSAGILVNNTSVTNVAVQILNLDGGSLISNVTVIATQFANPGVNSTPVLGSTTRNTAGGPAPGQAVKNYTGLVTGTGAAQTQTLETVTAGKTYLITDVIATTNDTVSGSILITITAAGTAIFQSHINSTKGIEAMGIETQPSGTAGQIIVLNIPSPGITSGKVIAFNVYGIEQ